MVELTLEVLDEAISRIKEYDYDNETIGFKLNPSDYRDIENRSKAIFAITDGKLIMQSSLHMYNGLRIESDVTVPLGCPQKILRSEEL